MNKKEIQSLKTYHEEYAKALEKYSKLKHVVDPETGDIERIFPSD